MISGIPPEFPGVTISRSRTPTINFCREFGDPSLKQIHLTKQIAFIENQRSTKLHFVRLCSVSCFLCLP
jgi:hypothetical protein